MLSEHKDTSYEHATSVFVTVSHPVLILSEVIMTVSVSLKHCAQHISLTALL